MATKATAEITVFDQTDATAVVTWYYGTRGTAPSAPTTTDADVTPSGWTKVEPTISGEADLSLMVYTCVQTVWGDGTCDWGTVSLSAAFEAAKVAYNLAHGTSQELANLSIGGANLIVFNKTMLGRLDANGEVYASSDGNYHMHTEPIPVEGGEPYVLSWFYKVTEYTNSFLYVSWLDTDGEHISRTNVEKITNVEPSYRKFISPENAAYAVVNIPTHLANKCMAKFEKGSVPSDMSLSVYDATNQPNMLRGTNQPDVLRDFGSDWTFWDDGLWRVQSGNAYNGDAEIFEVNDFEDTRQRYGFRVWSTTTGNKDVGQGKVPYKAGTYYRLVGFVRLTDTSPEQQTSATMQFRVFGSSAIKTYTLQVESNEWTRFAYAFALNADQAAVGHTTLFGVKGKGSLDFCGLYIHEGYAYCRMSLGEEYLPWQPATEDYASYGSTSSAIAETSANAVKRTQRIYYRTQSTTAPTSEFMPTAWVTETGDKWAADAATLSNWTTKVTPISHGTNKYLCLFTCEQREMGDGTLLYTNVLLDDSTTVIDGGSIITGSVAANRIDAASGTFSTANIPALTADHIKANVIDAVNNGTGKINADKINVNAISIGDLDGADGYATKEDAQGYATTVQNNLDGLVSVRLTMTRDAWTDAQWATYENIGHQADWTNGHFDKDGVQTSTGLSSDSLRVGDLIVISGVSKDTGNTHSVVIRVRVAPASSTAKISAETVSFNNSLQMVDYMQVGGENLLRKTASVTATDLARTRASVPEAGIIRLTPTTSASYAKFIVDYLDFAEYGEGSYTVSFDARLANVTTSYTNMNVGIYLGYSTASRTGVVFSSGYDNYCPMKVLATSLTSEWTRYSCTIDVPSDLTSGKAAARIAGSQLSVELAVDGSRKPVEVRRVKLERGTKATDWTPAQDDIDGAITDAAKTATNYVTAIDGKGIWVTPSNAKPDASGDEVAGTTTGWHISDALELFRQGVSMFKVWAEDAVTKVRVGAAGMAHILMSQSHIEITDGTESVFKVGSITDADGYAEVTERFVADGSAMQLHYVGNHIKGLDQSTTTPTIDPFEVVNLDTATTIDPSDYHFTTVAMASGTRVTLHWDGYTESDKDSVLAVTYYAKPGYGMQVGAESRAAGIASSALGNATAMGDYSHAEGMNSIATGYASHSEGGGKSGDFVIDGGVAVGDGSHAEGVGTIASGNASHTEGAYTKAVGNLSHAGGHGTIAASDAQTVIGRYNVEDASDEYAFIVGNGTSDSNRSNAMAVTWDGEIVGMPGETLFSDDSAPTSNLTGLPDLTEYSRLLIEYRDSGGRGGSVWVDRPSGGTLVNEYFNCMTAGGNNVAGLIIRAKTYFIEDSTTISASHDSYNRYDYSKVTISSSGGVTYANSNEIGIVKVIGFH